MRVLGVHCGRKRVARLMRKLGLRGCLRGRKKRTTRQNKYSTPAPDLVKRDFTTGAANRVWVADITYIKTAEDFLYLAFVLRAYSRRVVGWSMASHLRAELMVEALEMAIWRRKPAPGLTHHSDRCSQYTSLSFGKHLEEASVLPSMRRVDSAGDNAMAESFVPTLKAELIHDRQWPTKEAARSAIFEYLEAFYNRRRLHSALGYESPASYEQATMKGDAMA